MWRVLKCGGVLALLTLAALGAACSEEARRPPTLASPTGAGTGTGGVGIGGVLNFGGTESQPPLGPCAGIAPRAPLTRWSVADIDGTLESLFGPGPTLASALTIDDAGYQRDLSSAFVSALRKVARQRAAVPIPDTAPFELCEGDDDRPLCLEPWLRKWGEPLYRRPLTAEQVVAYEAQFRSARAQSTAGQAARNVLVSLILSPYFVFRVELGESANGEQLSAYEVAARLSHFAIRQAPDAALSQSAETGALKDPAERIAQLHRLWSSTAGHRARSLQHLEWLGLSDKTLPSTLDADLRADMLAQTNAFVNDVFDSQGATLSDLLTAQRQPMTARLAAHYGVTAPLGDGIGFVDAAPTLAAGVLSEGLFLSSYPRPTLRGRAIVQRLQCQRMPDHPPGVDRTLGAEGTPRQRIQQRVAANPACATCHQLIDPLGYPLDAFDDEGRVTGFDATSILPADANTGIAAQVASPRELGQVIASSGAGRSCAAQRYLEYAIDRELGNPGFTTKSARPPGSPGPAPVPVLRQDPDQDWLQCLVASSTNGDFSLNQAAEQIVAGSWLTMRAGIPRRFTAFDTSLDPVEHAYQEAAQFRGAFPDSSDDQTLQRYMEALQTVERLDALAPAMSGDGGAAGDAFGGAPSAGGAGGAP